MTPTCTKSLYIEHETLGVCGVSVNYLPSKYWFFQSCTLSLTFRANMVALSLLFITKLLQVAIADEPLHRKFEYKHSFRAPDLALRDGTIPFWTIAGDAVASSDQLRLAPSLRSRKGSL